VTAFFSEELPWLARRMNGSPSRWRILHRAHTHMLGRVTETVNGLRTQRPAELTPSVDRSKVTAGSKTRRSDEWMITAPTVVFDIVDQIKRGDD
jgi:hypothetical protein